MQRLGGALRRARLAWVGLLIAWAWSGTGCDEKIYYVDASVAVSGDGTLGLPFKTIAQASYFALPGDVIRIKGGATPYNEPINPVRSGSSSASPIHYIGYGTQPPRLVNGGGGIQPRVCISLDGRSYIVIQNILCDGGSSRATGFRAFALIHAGSFNQLLDSEYRGAAASSDDSLVVLSGDYANAVYARFNQFKNDKIAPSATHYPDEGVVIHRLCSNNLFENNEIVVSALHLAFQIQSSYNVIRNNRLSNPFGTTLALEQPLAAPFDAVEHNVLDGNSIYGGDGGSVADSALQLQAQRTIVRGNLFYGNSHAAISIGRGLDPYEAKYLNHNRIVHNVFHRNVSVAPGPGASAPYPIQVEISCATTVFGNTEDNALVNNVFFRNNQAQGVQVRMKMGFSFAPSSCATTTTPPRIFGVDGTVFQNNALRVDPSLPGGQAIIRIDQPSGADESLSAAQAHYAPLWAANLEADPAFVAPDAPTPDFHLLGTSPLIDRGRFLTTVSAVVGGAGTNFKLADPSYFTDGLGVGPGDTLQFEGRGTTTLMSVDYTTGDIAVSPPVTGVGVGTHVSLRWNGSAPDIGAFEF